MKYCSEELYLTFCPVVDRLLSGHSHSILFHFIQFCMFSVTTVPPQSIDACVRCLHQILFQCLSRNHAASRIVVTARCHHKPLVGDAASARAFVIQPAVASTVPDGAAVDRSADAG